MSDIFQSIMQGAPAAELDVAYPFYPLTSPGMPMPGENFLAAAAALGDPSPDIAGGTVRTQHLTACGPALHYLYRRALYDETFQLNVTIRGGYRTTALVPGHLLGVETTNTGGGPIRARVMIIGKNPGQDEVQRRRNLVGPTSMVFTDALDYLSVSEAERGSWYITNLVKWPQLDMQTDTLPTAHKKDCQILLEQELRLVRPDFILCLGSDASKALLGTSWGVTALVGRALDYHILTSDAGEPEQYHTAKVMGIVHPAQVFRRPEMEDEFRSQLGLFLQLCEGADIGGRELWVDHRDVYKESDLAAIIDGIRADPDPWRRVIAVDGEWNGVYPGEPNAYLRTIQFSSRHGEGINVVLRHQGGAPAFQPSIGHAVAQLRRLLKNDPAAGWFPRVGGHFFRADLPWLIDAGLDVREEYAPAVNPEMLRTDGGWDTGLMYHAYNEATSYRLTDMQVRLTAAPVYDTPIKTAIENYCKERGLKKEDLEGFGFLPNWKLHPYACLHGDSLVQLADGSWEKIKRLVATRYAGHVRALVNGQVTTAAVTNWHRHAVRQKEWFSVITATTASGRWGVLGPRLTPDHEIVTQRGKVRVDALRIGVDAVATDERQFSREQLSVCLACLLGDGGFTDKNGVQAGFAFSQRNAVAGYADWKAAVFSTHGVVLRNNPSEAGARSYELLFSRYLRSLERRFARKLRSSHRHRKLVITPAVLADLGLLGLAVWYQDAGSFVPNAPGLLTGSSRIYAKIPPGEQTIVIAYLTEQFGSGVSYNQGNRFINIKGEAFDAFHAAINPYIHPTMAYKTPLPVGSGYVVDQRSRLFYEPIVAVVPWVMAKPRRGNGVRYCLTTTAGNFLTQAGFVSNCYDPDVTRRIAIRHLDNSGLLDADWFGNACWEPYLTSHRASLGFLEMERTGLTLDKPRVDKLTALYEYAYELLLADFRRKINWDLPDPTDRKGIRRLQFNPNSAPQCVAFLFGDTYARKIDPETNTYVSPRPPEAMTLNLTPIKSTGKRPQLWENLVARGQTRGVTPSTDKESLGIIGHSHPLAMQLRDIKFIAQILKGPLRAPIRGDDGVPTLDEDGNREYEKGLASYVLSDGRLHTHLSQVKETGRASSARPPLQNISSKRESDYARILGHLDRKQRHVGSYKDIFPEPLYTHPIRSIFRAEDGCVLVSADYTGAEVAMIAWLSGDATMIEQVRRNSLPEDHPDHYDIHSHNAVSCFHLPCAPSKKGLADAGFSAMRVAAKNVVFGIPYGRSAEAIARQCREEGTDVTTEDCQKIIDFYYFQYPKTRPFLEECAERTQRERWIAGTNGRFRRFIQSRDRGVVSEQKRQGQNFPEQNGVADNVSLALYNFGEIRKEEPDVQFRIVLQMHDALIFEVPVPHLKRFYVDEQDADGKITSSSILRKCMVDRVPVWPRYLDNRPMPVERPYFFSIDSDLYLNWGERITADQAAKLGIDPAWL